MSSLGGLVYGMVWKIWVGLMHRRKFVLEFGRSFSNQCNHYTDKTTIIRMINKKISLLGRVVHDLKTISKITVEFVYDINHMYALWIEKTSERDPRSYEASKAVAKKAQKKHSEALTGFEPMTPAIPVRCSTN